MMVKITEHCSMGCKHCMNDATPNNKHMSSDVFHKALAFHNAYCGSIMLMTGGEPTEHPQFKEFLEEAVSVVPYIAVTTNGIWMQNEYDYVLHMQQQYGKRIMWQVSCDSEFYPKHIDQSLPVFQISTVEVFPKQREVYPQGRAVTNNLECYKPKCSKCFNIRAMVKQVSWGTPLAVILLMMQAKGIFCTPHITIDGGIKLGESDLCPPCSSIFKPADDIIEDIRNFSCHKCDHINKNLAPQYAVFVDAPLGGD